VSESPGITLANAASYDMDLSVCTGTTDTLYTTTSLVPGTRYYFVVTYKDGSNESTVSAEVSAMPVSQPLNDTGIELCADGATNNLDCPQTGYPSQDAENGRDADSGLIKVGGGDAGFDFTKLDADGAALTDQGADYATTPWACVRDNHTGLIWEVKTRNDSFDDSHGWNYLFTWYNSDPDTNGGTAGFEGGLGNCSDDFLACDTEKFVARVNAANFCGATNWRMPTRQELLSIVHNGRTNPAIDTDWFPNTRSELFWSSSMRSDFSDSSSRVRAVNFDSGLTATASKRPIGSELTNEYPVRLVREEQ
jgi:hypothetical protein